ncbi:MAG TPA: hypothetical protein VN317_02130 [Candidatus Methanoperedens sp.]|nr:hypothetical protein [Candidatus Methanoperedens sp.]
MSRPGKPRLALYWASSCGGCEVSLLNTGERLLLLGETFDLVFCPCLADFKLEDVRGFPDGFIDLCLFNGAIRSSENRQMAYLLRRKSALLVAFGSCAQEGCVPGLANLSTAAALRETVYLGGPSTENPDGALPRERCDVREGSLALPALYDTVRTLDQVESVDYFVPGCPPESPRVWEVLQRLAASLVDGAPLPPRGAVLGALETAVCEECPRARISRRVERFYRVHELAPDPGACLLEQGLICLGVATRGGCGALCPRVAMGCRGCYGAPPGVEDQGARMVAAIAALSGAGDPEGGEERLREQIEAAFSTIVDPVGTFYRYSLAHSLLRRARVRPPAGGGEAGR